MVDFLLLRQTFLLDILLHPSYIMLLVSRKKNHLIYLVYYLFITLNSDKVKHKGDHVRCYFKRIGGGASTNGQIQDKLNDFTAYMDRVSYIPLTTNSLFNLLIYQYYYYCCCYRLHFL